ncbi:MAG: protein kinase [Geodermatophilaceae bacterium]|nr:protein kinase [Geodermatophilaceae bacterium]
MGTVYLAHHPRLPRKDALKLLRADLSADPGFRARFEREADLASRLDHGNIVTVYDRGCTDEQLWIDMQYVDGIDASQALEGTPAAMTVDRVLRIVGEVGSGLDFAHRHGLWHRDVKPANILLADSNDPEEPERVLLTDFGVAKAVDEARQLTSTGNMLATLAYAAPEQIESRALDHRVDIYALGCVLYELLTGMVPFPEDTAYATMAAHLNKPPPRPSAVLSSLPAGLDDVVARAMAKNREDRFASCRELAKAARATLNPPAEPARPIARVSTAPVTQVQSVPRPPAPGPVPTAEPPTPSAPPQRVPSDTSAGRLEVPPGPRPPYQLRVRRTGAEGALELGPVFTDAMSLLETGALSDLLDRARFFELPPNLPTDRPGPGAVRQEIIVISAGRSHTVGYDLTGSRRPPALDEFVTRLERHAGWRRTGPPPVAPSLPIPAPVPPAGSGRPPTGPIPHQEVGAPWWKRKALVAAVVAAVVLAVTGTVLAFGGADGLAAPASVEANTDGATVELQWAEVDQASGYQVLRDGDVLDTTQETSYTDEEVEPGGRYRYSVVATGRNGLESDASREQTVTVPEARAAPAAPTGLSLSSVGGVVTVTWDEVDGASSYNLFRGTVRVYGGPETTYVDENAPLGTNSYSVLASVADGTQSERSLVAPITLSDTWGDLVYIVAAFPNLLPANPLEQGYQMSTCGVETDADDIHTDGVAVCDYPNGIHLELLHYPSVEALQAREQEIATDAAAPETWQYRQDDDSLIDGGTVYSNVEGEEPAFRWATFVAPELTLFALHVSWPGHTSDELFDTWWLPAPF